MCFVDFTYKKDMETKKGITSALEVFDNIKSSLNLADKVKENEPEDKVDQNGANNFEDLVLQTETNEDKNAINIPEVTYRKTNSNTNNEISKMRLGKTISNGMNFTERAGSDYLLKSNNELERGKKTQSKPKQNSILVERASDKSKLTGAPEKMMASSTKLGIKVKLKLI
jgi:hypothetical protein